LKTPGRRFAGFVLAPCARLTARGAAISKLVALVADVLLARLVGVLALPVSSSSTVKGKVWEGGVIVAVISLAERLALADAVGPKVEHGVPDPPTVIPVRPAGKDAAPVFTHHSYVVAPKPPAAP
jgi:hypothetical protein